MFSLAKVLSGPTAEVGAFDESIEKIVNKILESSSKPYLLAVLGFPNSGKSYLIENAEKELLSKGYLENMLQVLYASDLSGLDIRRKEKTLETASRLNTKIVIVQNEAPDEIDRINRGYKQVFGRKADLNVLVTNPHMYNAQDFYPLFDLVVVNPGSKIKV